MIKEKKLARESVTTMTQLVFPNDTNPLNGLMGGKMMQWIDIVAAIAAQKHSNSVVVTASVDHISFKKVVQVGDVVTLKAYVTKAFSTSMEVFIEVWAENIPKGKKVMTNHAFFTFVAVNEENKPTKVPQVIPESDQEKELYDSADSRRDVRLKMAQRIYPLPDPS